MVLVSIALRSKSLGEAKCQTKHYELPAPVVFGGTLVTPLHSFYIRPK